MSTRIAENITENKSIINNDGKKISNRNHEIWTLLDSAHFAISRVRLLEIAQYGLTKEQAQMLYIIQNKGGAATVSQIADFSMRQLHSISSLINRMVKAGLVKKVKSPKDKAFKIVMTRKGEEKYSKLTRESIDMTLAALSPADKERLIEYLNELQISARKLLGLDQKLPFLKARAGEGSHSHFEASDR